jgi:hypothetical protein
MSAFKSLRGRTILLDVPQRKKSSIELSAKDEEAMMQEAAKLWNKLTVYAVGDKVEEVKVGDQVYVRTSALNMEQVERIDIDGEINVSDISLTDREAKSTFIGVSRKLNVDYVPEPTIADLDKKLSDTLSFVEPMIFPQV